MRLLGIETSCDETAAAIVERDDAGHGRILSNIVRSQLEEHAPYGGVVPELAARAHVSHLDHIIFRASAEAGVPLSEIESSSNWRGSAIKGTIPVAPSMSSRIHSLEIAYGRCFERY